MERLRKAHSESGRARSERMVFRVDVETKSMVERAAELERRNLTDYCLTALSEAAQETLARHDMLRLTDAERRVFFDVLTHPPEPNDRLQRAVAASRRRVAA